MITAIADEMNDEQLDVEQNHGAYSDLHSSIRLAMIACTVNTVPCTQFHDCGSVFSENTLDSVDDPCDANRKTVCHPCSCAISSSEAMFCHFAVQFHR